MIRPARWVFPALVLWSLCAGSLLAQRHRDPMTKKEADEMRESADEPNKRLPLLVQFARARLDEVEHMRSDPRLVSGRGRKVHDLLEDFTSLIDELGDNVDDYARQKSDIRKGLKAVVDGTTDFEKRLTALKESSGKPEYAEEFREYSFPLDSALDAVSGNLDAARKTMQEQEVLAKQRAEEAKTASKKK